MYTFTHVNSGTTSPDCVLVLEVTMRHLLVSLSFFLSVGVLVLGSLHGPLNNTGPHLRLRQELQKSVGEALILTPYLEQGKIHRARQLSEVYHPRFPDMKSYSGYFTMKKQCDSNLFFWFLPARSN